MSTISGVGGASSAWSDYSTSRTGAMKQKMFAKVDTDGNGSIDKTELQSMLDKIASKTGRTASDAGDLMSKFDSDGNGSLSSDELAAGMKSLMPAPSSTMDFVQQRSGDESGAASGLFAKLDSDGSGGLDPTELNTLLDKMVSNASAAAGGNGAAGNSSDPNSVAGKADAAIFKKMDTDGDGTISKSEFRAAVSHHHEAGRGGPPPEATSASGSDGIGSSTSASSSSSTASTDPLDTNGDGVVSDQERAAGAMKDLMQTMMKAMDSNGDGSISQSEADSFKTQMATALGGTASPGTSSGASDSTTGSGDGTASRGRLNLSALRDFVNQEYSQAAANYASTSTVDVAA